MFILQDSYFFIFEGNAEDYADIASEASKGIEIGGYVKVNR